MHDYRVTIFPKKGRPWRHWYFAASREEALREAWHDFANAAKITAERV